MSLLDVALACIARGWYVLPVPRDGKKPIGGLVPRGVLDATNDEATVRRWWRVKPDANVGIACGKSRLAVLDCDKGNHSALSFWNWVEEENIPETYTTRTGRRPSLGTHMYFTVPEETPTFSYSRNGRGGELRSGGVDGGAYVLAAGSIHTSGEAYEILIDAPLAELPGSIRAWAPPKKAFDAEGDGDLDALREGLAKLGLDYEDAGDKLFIDCPWIHEHSMYSGPSQTALFVKNGLYCFKCHHSSCGGRGYATFKREVSK